MVVVTGASRGLGRVYAEKFARLGARVVLIARGQERLDEVTNAIRKGGGEAICVAADVVDQQSITRAFGVIDSYYDHIDLLINNAGNLGATGFTWELDAREWWSTLQLHLLGGFYCIQEALRRMVPRRSGRIISLASHAGAFRWPTLSAYSVAKAALIKLNENVAVEAGKHGVALFAFHPGVVRDTGILPNLQADESTQPALLDVITWLSQQVADGHSTTAEQGAAVLVQLASGRYDFLNGRYITVYDDLDGLSEQSEQIRHGDAMTMRVVHCEPLGCKRQLAMMGEEAMV
ncbi:SDR family oxidoreductase [Dyella sp. M7H15-1]|uniref:SDR family NAD(P)-dependent oxidoreductase n=1 Tax=Dyella sp. M7H15-1 TaxID=2501295 RepID=UPI0013E8A94D|nr:SDR family oxidoreductase [Dyella sp. M7H15-1]